MPQPTFAGTNYPTFGGLGLPNRASYSAIVKGDSPVAYWRLDDTGGTAVDQINGYNGALTGGVTTGVTGAISGDTALTFNLTNGFIKINILTALHPGDTFTLECWYKRNAIGANVDVISGGVGDYELLFSSVNQITINKLNVAQVFVSTAAFTDTTSWHHLVVTKSAATFVVYHDTAVVVGTFTNATIVPSATNPRIAAKVDGSQFFSGSLDEVAIYNYAITANQVLSHFSAQTNTLANINLNDGTVWSVQNFNIDHTNRQLGIQQQVTRAKGVYVSDDFLPKTISIPMRYQETSNPLGQALATLSQASEQQLSFDGTTYILAKYAGAGTPRLIRRFAPLIWELTLDFTCREPWFKDIASTTSPTTTIASAPTAPPAATAANGGALTAGTYTLAYTYIGPSGETAASPSNIVAGNAPVSDYRYGRVSYRHSSRTTGNALASGMQGGGTATRELRSYSSTRVTSPKSDAVILSGASLQISVGAVTFPSWATGVKWYFTGSSPTTGFTVQNANGNAFTLNTAGNGSGPPTTTPTTVALITYAGSVFAEPIFTITIPATNPNSITSLTLQNLLAGELLTINFPGMMLGGRATTLTIDCGAWTVADAAGNSYDSTGSFPQVYGPVGQVNTYVAQLVGSPADAVGVTLSATYNCRWEEF